MGLIRAGLLRLDDFEVTEFALRDIHAAVAHAIAQGGLFKRTVVRR